METDLETETVTETETVVAADDSVVQ
jgi:hypothetical protein